jgi:lysine-N-methylase
MTRRVRPLEVVAPHWDCHGCSFCCREYNVPVTEAERDRLAAHDWSPDLPAGTPPAVPDGGRLRLSQKADGSCVFLDADGRCRVHAKLGPAAKPLNCRIYPFVLVPVGDHWRVGLRFACPSVAADQGRPLAAHDAELKEYARQFTERLGPGGAPPPPDLQPGQEVPWGDLVTFVRGLCALLADRADPLERRLRKCLALATLCRHATFDKVTGSRLVEFLNLIGPALDAEVPATAAHVAPPDWVGRVLFRQAAALYSRKDQGPLRGIGRQGRLTLMWAAWRFLRGTGAVPRLNATMPETTFEMVEAATGTLPPDADEVLTRYYLVKVESMQFAGKTNFNLTFWEGLDALALTYPMVTWLTRVLHHLPRGEALQTALRIVDDSFGFHPLLGTPRQRWAMRVLSQRGQLPRLVAWYSR